MKLLRILSACLAVIWMGSCGEEVTIKPEAKLRLQYPEPTYDTLKIDCPFSFERNKLASVTVKSNCAVNIDYPSMEATIYLTYQPVHENLVGLLTDAQKLTYDHTVKASEIFEQPRIDSIEKVYGMFYMINGDAATQSQFYVTDSLHHFVNGALYFNTKPNFDSIYPAAVYLRRDIRRIMESMKWK